MGQLGPLVIRPLHSIPPADRATAEALAVHSPMHNTVRGEGRYQRRLARFRIEGAVAVPGRYSFSKVESAFSTDLTAERDANSKLDRYQPGVPQYGLQRGLRDGKRSPGAREGEECLP